MTQKKLKIIERVCPVCLGKGKIKSGIGGYSYYTAEIRKQARDLFRQGYSLRAIGKKIGITGSPQKVASMIKSVRF